MAQAPALPAGFELPLEARLPRIGAVDAVALEERAASLAKRSIKREAKVWALNLAIRTTDLTTLEGSDTPGKAAAIASKARRPDPSDPSVPPVAAVCVYPNLVPAVRERLAGSDVKVAAVATGFPSGQYPTAVKVADVRATVELGRGRDRHGDRPRRLPVGPLREGLRRDRPGEGGVRRRAPEGDPRDRRARDVRQRAPRDAARDSGRGRLRQDVDREDLAGRDAARRALHARGDPRRVRGDRAARRASRRRAGSGRRSRRCSTSSSCTRRSGRNG